MCTQKNFPMGWVGGTKMRRTLRVGLNAAAFVCALTLSTAATADAPLTPAAGGSQVPGFAPPGVGPVGPAPMPMWGGGPWGGFTQGEAEQQFKRKKSMILAGSIIFGLTYYTTIAFASAAVSRGGINSREFIPALFPWVGPFVTAVQRAEPNRITLSGLPGEPDYAGMGAFIASGVVQLVGTGIVIAGLTMPTGKSPDPCAEKRMGVEPRCREIKIAVLPTVTPTSAGAALTGSF
ncbi:MAG: hypothetical protein IPK82_37600 [Polyangiaceae bacterium]|nr:hypothetical protein [Polyangiaceae bacterium]